MCRAAENLFSPVMTFFRICHQLQCLHTWFTRDNYVPQNIMLSGRLARLVKQCVCVCNGIKQEAQLMLTNPRDAEVSQGHQTQYHSIC